MGDKPETTRMQQPPSTSSPFETLSFPLAIGTLQWGTTAIDDSVINPSGVISESEASAIVQEATRQGVTVWDTAEGYGGGTSEKRLGRLLLSQDDDIIDDDSKQRQANTMVLMTKFLPVPWRLSHGAFEDAVRASCQRLQVDCIPIYFLHSPIHLWRPIEFWIEAAAKCKKKGYIRYLGLSNCNAAQVREAVQAGQQLGIDIVCNQVHYSLLDYQSPALQEMEKTCQELGVTVIGFSPIGQGLLTDKLTLERFRTNRPAKMWRLQWDDLVPLRTCLKELATKYEKSMAQIAINWCLCHGVIPLVGCRSVSQLKDSLGSVGWQLDESDVQQLDDLAFAKNSTLSSRSWKRHLFVTLFGVVMVVCRTLDAWGYGMVKSASS